MSQSLNVALCSYGMSGQVFHAPLIHGQAGFVLHTILQRNSNSAKEKYQNVQIVADFESIIINPAIDVVVVNTPNELHFSMTKAALEAGKHVVVEKPFTIFSDQAQELIALAEEKKLVLTVFHNKRLESDYLSLKEVINNQKIGNIVEINWRYDRFRNHITHKVWKEDNRPGAGTLYDLGVHLIDSALSIFGKPLAITAHQRILRKEASSTDYFNIRLDYNHLTVNLGSTTLAKYQVPVLVAHGDEGSMVFNASDIQEQQLKNGVSPDDNEFGINSTHPHYQIYTNINNEDKMLEMNAPKGNYKAFYQNLYEAITIQKPLLVKPQEALETIKLIESALKSDAEKRTILL